MCQLQRQSSKSMRLKHAEIVFTNLMFPASPTVQVVTGRNGANEMRKCLLEY